MGRTKRTKAKSEINEETTSHYLSERAASALVSQLQRLGFRARYLRPGHLPADLSRFKLTEATTYDDIEIQHIFRNVPFNELIEVMGAPGTASKVNYRIRVGHK